MEVYITKDLNGYVSIHFHKPEKSGGVWLSPSHSGLHLQNVDGFKEIPNGGIKEMELKELSLTAQSAAVSRV